MPDFSDEVDAQIGEASGLDTIEANLSLWLDASSIDAASNATLSDGDAISEWKDLSSNGHNGSQDVENQKPIYSIASGGQIYFEGDHFNITPFPVDDGFTVAEIFVVNKTSATSNGHFIIGVVKHRMVITRIVMVTYMKHLV